MSTKFVSATALLASIGTLAAPGTARACGTEAYIGQICTMATQYCPLNTGEASGQLLSVTQYQALFSLIGCTFGGDCRTNFALPDLRGRAPVGYGQGVGLTNHNFGTYFGYEDMSMTLAQMPTHTHAATFTSGGGGTQSVTVNVPIGTGTGNTSTVQSGDTVYLSGASVSTTGFDTVTITGPYTNTAPTTSATLGGITAAATGGSTSGVVTVDPTGGSQPMPIVPPELAMRYCIVINGLYPSRP